MATKKYQRGMTIWSATFVVGVFVFLFFLLFKLFPVYMEDFKVRKALEGVAQSADIATMSKADISGALEKRFDIDNVAKVDPRKNLFIEARGRNSRALRISYEAVIPLFYNVSVLVEFEHVKEVRGTE